MSNDTQDLDARVAEALADIVQARESDRELFFDEEEAIIALLRDLHAALKAARGEEFERWGLFQGDDLLDMFVSRHEAHSHADMLEDSVPTNGPGYTVRRVLCRDAPDDGGEG